MDMNLQRDCPLSVNPGLKLHKNKRFPPNAQGKIWPICPNLKSVGSTVNILDEKTNWPCSKLSYTG